MNSENLSNFFMFSTVIFRAIRVSRWLFSLEHRVKRLEGK